MAQGHTIRYPKALKAGDTVAIISPASPSSESDFDEGVRYLTMLGLKPRLMPHAQEQNRYLAGSDDERLADLHAAFADPTIDGILCARGGYGCMRLLEKLDWVLIEENPKVFIGFSDLTSLHLPIFERTGLVTFHGPMLTSNLIEHDAYTQGELWAQVMGTARYPYVVPNEVAYHCIRPGQAEGPLLGGNLSLLAGLCGTPYQPDMTGAILFIEDWKEQFYSIDRQITQMRLAGLFDGIAGLLLGDFVHIDEPWQDYTLVDLFTDLFDFVHVPMGIGYSVGHGVKTATFPIGGPSRFEASAGRLEILSSCVDLGVSAQG